MSEPDCSQQAYAEERHDHDRRRLEDRLAEAEKLLSVCRDEFAKLPRSLAYDFTYIPKLDAFLSTTDY